MKKEKEEIKIKKRGTEGKRDKIEDNEIRN